MDKITKLSQAIRYGSTFLGECLNYTWRASTTDLMNTITADRITPAIPTLNVDLLLRVADTIAKHPQAFDMGRWDCGTTACIAGWALRLSGKRWGAGHSTEDAAKELGLSKATASKLFYRADWPEHFTHARYVEDKVSTTIARIHHFIRTGL